MYFLPCSHERCLLLNCVAEARGHSPCVKKTSVLSRPKEGGKEQVRSFGFCCFNDFTAMVGDLSWTQTEEHPFCAGTMSSSAPQIKQWS